MIELDKERNEECWERNVKCWYSPMFWILSITIGVLFAEFLNQAFGMFVVGYALCGLVLALQEWYDYKKTMELRK